MHRYYINYNYEKSFERIDGIIEESDTSFEEAQNIPSRDVLTYTNGYYVNCSAIFIDIRDSSSLTDLHKRPKLAKLYRAYISEVVAVLNGNKDCVEIDIIGDGISGIFDAKYKTQISGVFSTGGMLGSLIDVMNYKFQKHKIENIKVGMGISYGRALMVKAGYNGSGINEIVWMGDVVNDAFRLSELPLRNSFSHEIMVSNGFYQNLTVEEQKILDRDYQNSCYRNILVNKEMDEWKKKNCN